MNIITGIVVFSIIWWLMLFIILPIGVSIDTTPEKGHADSAPSHPRIGRKFLITTLISLILFFIAQYILQQF